MSDGLESQGIQRLDCGMKRHEVDDLHIIKKNMTESQAVNFINSNNYKSAKRNWIELKHVKNRLKTQHGIKNNELTVSFFSK